MCTSRAAASHRASSSPRRRRTAPPGQIDVDGDGRLDLVFARQGLTARTPRSRSSRRGAARVRSRVRARTRGLDHALCSARVPLRRLRQDGDARRSSATESRTCSFDVLNAASRPVRARRRDARLGGHLPCSARAVRCARAARARCRSVGAAAARRADPDRPQADRHVVGGVGSSWTLSSTSVRSRSAARPARRERARRSADPDERGAVRRDLHVPGGPRRSGCGARRERDQRARGPTRRGRRRWNAGCNPSSARPCGPRSPP